MISVTRLPGQLRTQLFIGIEAALIQRSNGKRLVDEALQISKMLAGLIKHHRHLEK